MKSHYLLNSFWSSAKSVWVFDNLAGYFEQRERGRSLLVGNLAPKDGAAMQAVDDFFRDDKKTLSELLKEADDKKTLSELLKEVKILTHFAALSPSHRMLCSRRPTLSHNLQVMDGAESDSCSSDSSSDASSEVNSYF